eukprot:scaffold335064_cov37-Prasinocladus_malaysianus.AAC.1
MSQQVVASNATVIVSLKSRPDALATYMLPKPSSARRKGEHRSFRDGDYNRSEDSVIQFVPSVAAHGEPCSGLCLFVSPTM